MFAFDVYKLDLDEVDVFFSINHLCNTLHFIPKEVMIRSLGDVR